MRATILLMLAVPALLIGCASGLTESEVRRIVQEEAVQGPQGEPGPIGPRGPQGERGTAGLPGVPGEAGPQGEQDVAGPMGLTGAAGPMGLTGAAGPKGDIGLAGPAGPKGDIGLAGLAGPKGDVGPSGPPGAPSANPGTPDPTDTPTTVTVSPIAQGRGDSVVECVLTPGRKVLQISHTGQGHFAIWLYDNGGDQELLVNEVGPYSGSKLISVGSGFLDLTSGPCFMEITADGDWSVTKPN